MTKHYFLSYGGDPETNHPRLSGERLLPGTEIHVIDDFVHSGATLAAAVKTLREANLSVRSAAALLGSPPDTLLAAIEELHIKLTLGVATM